MTYTKHHSRHEPGGGRLPGAPQGPARRASQGPAHGEAWQMGRPMSPGPANDMRLAMSWAQALQKDHIRGGKI